MQRSTLYLFTLPVILLLSASLTSALDNADLAEIQRAIEQQGANWTAGDNPIFRLSTEEQLLRCGAQIEPRSEYLERTGPGQEPGTKFPERWDWRDVDGVNWLTPVRNQGPCGSCVAFGTMSAFEGLINIYSENPGQDLDLSEQHIFSCGGGSCDYGWSLEYAAAYLYHYGAPLEECSPYRAVHDNCIESCLDWQDQARKIISWSGIPLSYPEETVAEMKERLLDGPLVTAFEVYEDFNAYSSGVYQHVWGELLAGHCVCFVGWDDADSCWIIKNSWGPGWGEDGYFRIRMGTNEVAIEENAEWMIPEPAYFPYVHMTDYQIMDAAEGNGDGAPNARETFDFTVTLANPRTWAPVTDLNGWLASTDPRINALDVMAFFPDLPDGGSCTNAGDPFTISMAGKIGIDPLILSLHITGTCNDALPYSREIPMEMPITLPQQGWPKETMVAVRCSPAMVWAEGTRRLAVMEDNGTLHLWDESGQEVSGFPFYARGGQVWGSVALGDLTGDGKEELIFGTKNDTLYALHTDGTALFRRHMEADILATPAVIDVNADGSPEIILGTMDAQLHVLTAQGQKFGPFPIVLGAPVMADAALVDLNQDGYLDVVVGASDGQVHAISVTTGESLPGFPVATGGAIWSGPAIADLNKDGQVEIILGSDDGNLYAISASGSILFTYPTGQPIRSSPAVADLNQDNRLEVIFTSQSGRVYAVNYQGQDLDGWPYRVGQVLWTSPIVVDIDGDEALEVVLETPGPRLIHLEADGSLGLILDIDFSGTVMSTPVAGDLDNDGDLEIAVGAPGGVCVWNYPTASTVDMPWPMYRGNARRTGNIEDVTTGRPEDGPMVSPLPGEYALQQNYPNPFNPETTIRYALAQDGPARLTIYNVLGQEIVSLVDGPQPAGQHTAVWNGVDAGGRSVSSGLYFYRLQAGDFVQTKKMVLLR